MYSKGDIVSVNFPFSDLRNSKPRPALVLSGRRVNQTTDYILVQLTSKAWPDGLSVPLLASDYKGQPLPLTSYGYTSCLRPTRASSIENLPALLPGSVRGW